MGAKALAREHKSSHVAASFPLKGLHLHLLFAKIQLVCFVLHLSAKPTYLSDIKILAQEQDGHLSLSSLGDGSNSISGAEGLNQPPAAILNILGVCFLSDKRSPSLQRPSELKSKTKGGLFHQHIYVTVGVVFCFMDKQTNKKYVFF